MSNVCVLNVDHTSLDNKMGIQPKILQQPFVAPSPSIMLGPTSSYTFSGPQRETRKHIVSMKSNDVVLPQTFTSPKKCWWCHQSFLQNPIGCPLKCVEECVYVTHGIFDTWGCVFAYANTQKKCSEFKDSLQLVLKMYDECGLKGNINPAPHFSLLTEYGGVLSVEEYRSKYETYTNTNNLYTKVPPSVQYTTGKIFQVATKF